MNTPTPEQMRAYLDGEHGPPHPEAVQIVRDNLAAAIHPDSGCYCEVSPPEFGGRLADRECPLHGEASQ